MIKMEEIRKFHNNLKRDLITRYCKERSILDVGCGFGGDLKKYRMVIPFTLDMCDPSPEALMEARARAEGLGMSVTFHEGDILQMPMQKWDVIVYNFSLQYIFESRELFMRSMHAIAERLVHGGRLIGIVPDSMQILLQTPYTDSLGNIFMRDLETTGKGEFGEKLHVSLADSPFYVMMKSEPIAYKNQLVEHAASVRLHLETWEPVRRSGVSSLYSTFSFVKR